MAEGDALVRAGKWRSWGPMLLLGRDVHGATLGIVGMGRIGRAVARRGRGFGMRLLYTGTRRHPEVEAELGAEYCDLPELLRRSDFVSLHVPLTPATTRLIGARELALMKPDAVLVNTSRGPVVDEAALVEALNAGRLGGAALDVMEREPIGPGHPLLSAPRVVLTPHIGSASVVTRTRMAEMAAENLVAALSGDRPPNLVNPEAWERRRVLGVAGRGGRSGPCRQSVTGAG
ncbi:MAG: D-glycerate dehydrogenase [Acetobacteraceae bacterium]|nr:D-glycerate dehydrogenase [Acetobacteraceae bacterium]